MHDWIYDNDPAPSEDAVIEHARSMGLDMDHFLDDLNGETIRARVDEDLDEGRRNGVTGTPTLFVDDLRYDDAWDFYTMLEALERPVAARISRSARVFASLPASGGIALLIAAAVALICANSPLAPLYDLFVDSSFGIGTPGGLLTLSVRDWFSEGLLAIFFLLVGLESGAR
jgi:NhaA family Na+:H+ antiporter